MKIIGAIVVIILASLGFTWYSGNLTEQAIENYVATINEQPAYTAELVSYDHGLFQSSANINLKPDLSMLFGDMDPLTQQQLFAMLGGIDQGFSYNINIFHGPVVVHDGFYLGLFKADVAADSNTPYIQNTIPAGIDINDYFDMNFEMNYFGKGMFEANVVAFDTTDANGSFNWGGMELEAELEGYGKQYEMDGTIHPISVISPVFDFNTSSILLSGKGSIGDLITEGEGEISMASLNISGLGNDFSMNDFEIAADIDTTDEGTFSIDYEFGTGLIDSTFLSQAINSITADFSIRDMSIEGFTRFYNTSMETSSMADPFEAQMLMMQSVADLFEGTPVFEIKELSYSQGSDINFRMGAEMGFTENVFANPAVMQGNPFLALNALKASLNLEFSSAFFSMALEAYISNQFSGLDMDQELLEQMKQQQLAQVKTMMAGMVQAGYLEVDDDEYSLEAEMENRQLLVNGNSMPLPF